MHPSESRRNLIRTLNVILTELDLDDAQVYPEGDERVPDMGVPAWARATLLDLPHKSVGRVEDLRATQAIHQLVVECWAVDNAEQQSGAVDRVEALVETVSTSFRYKNYPLYDYISGAPSPARIIGATLRFIEPPSVQRLDPVAGFQRRIVICPFTFFQRS